MSSAHEYDIPESQKVVAVKAEALDSYETRACIGFSTDVNENIIRAVL